MRLPYEDQAREVIRERLGPEFEVAAEVFDLAISLFKGRVTMNPAANLDDDVVVNVLGLLVKACKQHRGIVLLVEAGLDDVSISNVRMLFETMAAVRFLTLPSIALTRDGKPLPPVPGKELTIDFRSSLYRANEAFQHRKFQQGIAKLDGDVPAGLRKQVDDACAGWEADLGPEWTKRVSAQGYAGVHLKDLSQSLGLGGLYATIYRLGSSGVHAADSAEHSEWRDGEEGGWWFSVIPTQKEIALALGFSTALLFAILKSADGLLNLGCCKVIEGLGPKLAGMRHDFPGP